jgi:hypothetical protein
MQRVAQFKWLQLFKQGVRLYFYMHTSCVFLYLNQPCRAEKTNFRYKKTQVQAFEAVGLGTKTADLDI